MWLKLRKQLLTLGLLASVAGQASAQGLQPVLHQRGVTSSAPCTNCAPSTTTTSPSSTAPSTSAAPMAGEPGVAFAEAPSAGTGASDTFNPQMIGDFGGYRLRAVPNGHTSGHAVPGRAGSAIKIADNESPRPLDRVFVTYNYFNGLNDGNGRSVDLHRETFGFEKTFLDGNASIGVRLPFFQSNSTAPGITADGFGDVTAIAKYAFINDRETGNVASVGLAATFPTGPDIRSVRGDIDSILLQPFAGYIVNLSGNFFVQGFTSVIFPTDSNDTTVWLNDVGVGYNLWRCNDGLITSITPVLEAHVATPLQNDRLLTIPDMVTFTGGVHLGVGQRSLLTFGLVIPVTGPQPYDVEGMVQFNLRF